MEILIGLLVLVAVVAGVIGLVVILDRPRPHTELPRSPSRTLAQRPRPTGALPPALHAPQPPMPRVNQYGELE